MQWRNPVVGDMVYIRKDIIESPNDFSQGGIYAKHGDIVFVKEVNNETYHVHHPMKSGTFIVYRHEIMLTDPILTHEDKLNYLSRRGFKDINQRMKI